MHMKLNLLTSTYNQLNPTLQAQLIQYAERLLIQQNHTKVSQEHQQKFKALIERHTQGVN